MLPIQIEVYAHDDPTKKIEILNGKIDPRYLEEIGGPGGGSIRLNIHDPKIVSDPTVVQARNIIKLRIDNEIVGAFAIDEKSATHIADTKDKSIVEISGESIKGAWFADAAVYPERGLKRTSYTDRYFNFSSAPGPWYNPAQWENPTNVVKWGDIEGSPWRYAPANWPDVPDAYWVWSSNSYSVPEGDNYFRYSFTTVEKGKYSFFVAADDSFAIYVDGQLHASSSEDSNGWSEVTRVDVELHPGEHIFAVKVRNQSVGAAAFIAAVFREGDAALQIPATLISYTGKVGDNNWKVSGYPDPIPAFTPGEILNTLLDEAEARGVLFPTRITRTFTNTTDSYGDAWERHLDWEFAVGTPLTEVVERLEELVCDIWIDPDTYELHAVKERGVDRSVYGYDVDGITVNRPILRFEEGKNLTKAVTESAGDVKNSLLIKGAEGWLEKEDQESQSLNTYGRVEAFIDTGMSDDISSAVATTVFRQKGMPEVGASYDVIPFPGHTPWKDFQVGDWVLAPNDVGLLVKRRVMSISVKENSRTGFPEYAIEFDTIFKDNETKLNKWLEKVGGGSLGGSFANAGSGSSLPNGNPVVVKPDALVIQVPKKVQNLSASSVGTWEVTGVNAYSQITLNWDPVTQNTDNSATVPFAYEVWGYPSAAGIETISLLTVVFTNQAVLENYETGKAWKFKVRALNNADHQGAFSDEVTHIPEAPSAPMDAPTKPVLDSDSNMVSVTWDGLLGASEVPPPQFRYIFIETAPSSAGPWVLSGTPITLRTRRSIINNLPKGSVLWVRMRSVDGLDLISAPSEAESITVLGVSLAGLNDDVAEAIEDAYELAEEANNTANSVSGIASDALNTAQEAQATANGKNTVWYRTTEPPGSDHSEGDTWFDSDDGNRIYRWNGSSWVAQQLGSEALSTGVNQDIQESVTKSNLAIVSDSVEYAVGPNNTTPPTTGWLPSPPAWVDGSWIWERHTYTYGSGSQTTTDPVLMTGPKGDAGTSGKGISSIVEQYYLSTSPTTQTGGSWGASVPAWVDGRYYWTRSIITYTDSTTTTTDPVNVTGGKGASGSDGNDGADGRSITSVDIEYYLSTSSTTQTGGSWLTTPPTWVDGRYMWTRTKVTYSTGSPTTTSPVNLTGAKGATGNAGATVSTVTRYFRLAATTPATPSNPPTSPWTTTEPAYVPPSTDNLYYVDRTVLSNGTSSLSSVVLSSTYQAAKDAYVLANSALTTANGKNKIVRSSSVASSPGNYQAGDQWWQYIGTQIIAMWLHSGSAWVAQTLTDSVITNLNAGTITAGYLNAARINANTITGTHIAGDTVTADNMVAGTITAASGIIADAAITNAKIANVDASKITTGYLNSARIDANTITADKLVVGDFTNLFNNGRFDKGANGLAGWNSGTGAVVDDPDSPSGKALEISASSGYPNRYQTQTIPVVPGDKIHLSALHKTMTVGLGSPTIRIMFVRSDGSTLNQGAGATTSTNYVRSSLIYTAPADSIYARLWVELSAASGGLRTGRITDLKAVRVVPGVLIEDGAVTAAKMQAGTITAESGIIGSLDAGVITAGTLNAGRIGANTISTNKLAVGNFENILDDPSFEQSGTEFWNLPTPSIAYINTTNPRTGSRALRIREDSAGYVAARHQANIRVEAGEEWVFGAWVRGETTSTTLGAIELSMLWGEAPLGTTGGNAVVVASSPVDLTNQYVYVFGTWTVPAGAKYAKPRIVKRAGTNTSIWYNVDDLTFYKKVPGDLIVDGAITAGKIRANTINADHLNGKIITSEYIALQGIEGDSIANETIETRMIVDGAIKADQIEAGVIKTTHLEPGFGNSINIGGNFTITALSDDIAGVAASVGDVNNRVTDQQQYFNFDPSDGAIISSPASPFSVVIMNDKIEIRQNNIAVSYWKANVMYVKSMEVEEVSFNGIHKISTFGTGTVIRYIG